MEELVRVANSKAFNGHVDPKMLVSSKTDSSLVNPKPTSYVLGKDGNF